MKIIMSLLINVFIIVALSLPQPAQATNDSNNNSIAILSFEAGSVKLKGMLANKERNIISADDLSAELLKRLTSAFFNTKRFNIVERSNISKLFDEMKLQRSGDFDLESAVELGNMLGANIIVIGSYVANMEQKDDASKCKSDIELHLKLIDIQSAKIRDIIQVSARGSANTPLESMSDLLASLSKTLDRDITNRYPQVGYIIKVINSTEAVIDIGRKDGIREDDEFIFFKVSDDIIHPATKKVIKGEKTPLGELSIISITEESSIVKSNTADQLVLGSSIERKPRKAGFWENFMGLW